MLAEELGRSTFGGVAITALVHTDMASVACLQRRHEAQKDSWMPDIIAGEVITAVGVTEPDAGSDVKGIRTIARRDGDSYLLNGAKMFITNGVHADLYCVAAKTDPAVRPCQRISMFLVEKGTPGFHVGRALDKQGWRSSDTAELLFDDCRVPAENRARRRRPRLLRHHAQLPERTHRHRRDGDGRGAGGDRAHAGICAHPQGVRRAAVGHAGHPPAPGDAGGQGRGRPAARLSRRLARHAGLDATKEVSMVKAYCGELVNEVMYDCLQFHGGMGYMRESTIERMTRDARVQAIGGGATEVMLEEVAKRM